MIVIILVIPTLLFYLTLKIQPLCKGLLSILFYIILYIISALFKHIIFNIHCSLTDKIDYVAITDFTRIFSSVSDILFVIIIAIIMFILYKKLKH